MLCFLVFILVFFGGIYVSGDRVRDRAEVASNTKTPKPQKTAKPTKKPVQRVMQTQAPASEKAKTKAKKVKAKKSFKLNLKKKNKLSKGLYRLGKKLFYIKKNKKVATGYTKVEDSAYYFSPKTGFAVKKAWQEVEFEGETYKLYFDEDGQRVMDVTDLMEEDCKYQIDVNLAKNMLAIFAQDKDGKYSIPVKSMICSGGMAGHETIQGTYTGLIPLGEWHQLRYNSVGQYATRISGPYLFHSVVYDTFDSYSLDKEEYEKLGTSASHGCIRLQVIDAKWIFDRASQCQAKIYSDKSKKYLLDKPDMVEVGKDDQGNYYDPTDPNLAWAG
ncbi:MAG: L,D-transpeptidase [Eubacterium sp.]|nr:L,D-transpeptidase [Eubacterium sp.]